MKIYVAATLPRVILVLSVLGLIGACGTAPRQDSNQARLMAGVTTKAQARQIFGAPDSIEKSPNSNIETWQYHSLRWEDGKPRSKIQWVTIKDGRYLAHGDSLSGMAPAAEPAPPPSSKTKPRE